MSVGVNIRKRRLELRLSQQELADAMGYKTRSTITKIESGENDVSQKKLQKFAAVLNTTVEALISGMPTHAEPASDMTEYVDDHRQKKIAIVLAGGKGSQNRQNIPSQFVAIHGKPILVYAMDAYQSHPSIDGIYVVCLRGWESIVKAYAEQYGITKLKGLIPAGTSGILSLKNALDHISGQYAPEDLIFVQEATRPMVTTEMISQLLQVCLDKGSATICHSMRNYVQFQISGNAPSYVDRDSMIALQSPEAHSLSLMKEVFLKAQMMQHPLTESCCTMLLHHLGYPINFVESSVNNIKIARDEDIAAFRAMVKE